MYIFGGWNGHDTMDDIFQFSFGKLVVDKIFYFPLFSILVSKYWYEIRRVRGKKPPPRYRHTAIMCNQSMIIFGGVDTQKTRFNDIFTYEFDKRKWTNIETDKNGHDP